MEAQKAKYAGMDWQKTVDGLKWYDPEKMAAYAFLDQQNPRSISIDREIYTIIVERNGEFAALPAQEGLQNTSAGFQEYADSFRSAGIKGVNDVAMAHTHSRYGGPQSNVFSGSVATMSGDVGSSSCNRYNSYLGTPNGDFMLLKPFQDIGTRLGSLPYNGCYSNSVSWSPRDY